MKMWLTALAAASLSLSAAVTANAGTISIGYSQDGAAITTVAGSGVSDVFNIPVGGINTGFFLIARATGGATQPTLPSPGLLFSNNISVSMVPRVPRIRWTFSSRRKG